MSNQNAWNSAIDACTKAIEQWDGRDEQDLLDRLSDLKIYTTPEQPKSMSVTLASGGQVLVTLE